MNLFKDNFSKQSNEYLKFRPTYPDELFKFLSSLTDEHELAWDCGTGNGQAAVGLTDYFERIYATDASEKQIENAMRHEKITYVVEQVEHTSLKNHSVDLITIGLALHWFQFDRFYPEVQRVLKPNGVIAAWTYRLPSISNEIDIIVRKFHDEVVDEYWQPENRLVDQGYKTILFPFKEIEVPQFEMHKKWYLKDLVGLVGSWSAVQRIINQTGKDPVPELEAELNKVWGDGSKKEIKWELILKVGRHE